MQRSLKTVFSAEYKRRMAQMEGQPLGVSKDAKPGVDKVLPSRPSLDELMAMVNLFNLDDKSLMKLPGEPLPYLSEPTAKPIEPTGLVVNVASSGDRGSSMAPKPHGYQRNVETPRRLPKRDVHGQAITAKFSPSQSSSGGAQSRSNDSMRGEEHFRHVTPQCSSKSRSPSQTSSKGGRKHTCTHHKRKHSHSSSRQPCR